MTNSFVAIAYAKIKKHRETIFMMLTCLLILCGTFWLAQDKQAGHHELQSALVIEGIYKPAINDSILIPIDSDGSMITVDTSMPSQYFIKLALMDKDVVELVRVDKNSFKTLNQGQLVNVDRWIGRSGIVYWQEISPLVPQSAVHGYKIAQD